MRINISHLTLPENFHKITDFYIPSEAPLYGLMYPGPLQIMNMKEYADIVAVLLKEAKKSESLEFALELYHEGKRIILRGHSIDSVEGKVFIFRRLPSYIPKIEEIGMPTNIIELLLNDRLNNGGLVIIAGETGQGKSTTAAASIAYRLKTYGSFCLTIEDPVELPLQGFYDNPNNPNVKGVCFQTNIDSDGISDAIKSSLRCYPAVSNSILFLGETRDAAMASEVLKIAANGHLVVTTMHGADLMIALRRFMNLAMSHKNANENEVKAMFSSVFRLMIHQRMETLQNGKKKIKPTVLFSPSSSSAIATRLRSGGLELLATEIQNQNMILSKGGSLMNLSATSSSSGV
jgi:Tfp pilus assembly pilus retraction ATPase PilT